MSERERFEEGMPGLLKAMRWAYDNFYVKGYSNVDEREGYISALEDDLPVLFGQVDDLVALVARLVRSLRKAAPGDALADGAMDYLRRKGLNPSPLRTVPEPGQAASGSSQGARSDYPEAAALLCERFARDFTTTPPKNEFEHGVQTATTRLAEAFRRQPEALEPSGSTYGIIDPDYGRAYTIARKLAWEEGYAIGLHGSFTRDLDLVAVPWVEKPCEPFHLVRRIVAATGLKLRSETPGAKPQGRLVWTLLFPSFGDPRFVDFSVIPPARSGAGSEEGGQG